MGLTIHYTLSLKQDCSPSVVREMAERTACYARKIGCAEASDVLKAHEDVKCAGIFTRVGPKAEGRYAFVPPKRGWLVHVWPGEGCESATFGLCQYPPRMPSGKGTVPTGFKGGWKLQGFCKTQYAGEGGWAHFFKCHRQIISLLDFWREMGAAVKVNDEGGYWETRSEEKLRAILGQYDGLVAAVGGMFKDALEKQGHPAPVKSPIFDYANFERLEHEGMAEFGVRIEELRKKFGKVL